MSLNRYGDAYRPTTGAHGADIASQRVDALDLACLAFCAEHANSGRTAVDLGCGAGAQSLRLALLGLRVVAVDLARPERMLAFADAFIGPDAVRFAAVDMAETSTAEAATDVICVYSQRALHFLRFDAAAQAMAAWARAANPEARFFLSVSGMGSELSDGYAAGDAPLEARFGPLAADRARAHGVHAPVCLYAPDDLAALARRAGLRVLDLWESPFGNVKGVFARA